MILKVVNIEDLLKKNKKISFILIYGPNEGLVREIIIKLVAQFKLKSSVDEITINGKDLDSNSNLLSDEIKSFSMFANNKVILVEDLKDKHVDSLSEVETD